MYIYRKSGILRKIEIRFVIFDLQLFPVSVSVFNVYCY